MPSPRHKGRPAVLYGVSRGAEAALLIASYQPHLFDAVIASSPSYLINPGYGGEPGPAWTFHGKAVPEGTNMPVGRIRVPLLLGDGGQDVVWNSAGSATAIIQELGAAHGPLGGTRQADALANERSWARMISFLNQPWRGAH
jgi:pimeloyl-ACP methyl ester carboxylesterase